MIDKKLLTSLTIVCIFWNLEAYTDGPVKSDGPVDKLWPHSFGGFDLEVPPQLDSRLGRERYLNHGSNSYDPYQDMLGDPTHVVKNTLKLWRSQVAMRLHVQRVVQSDKNAVGFDFESSVNLLVMVGTKLVN